MDLSGTETAASFFVQCCIFGICIPLDVVLPGLFAVFYYLRADALRWWRSFLVLLGLRTVEASAPSSADDTVTADKQDRTCTGCCAPSTDTPALKSE